ncbi:Mitogen-activated protein kinase kinase kinase 11 [Portunus trituberculatus]|uniref:Mitogen-activated protein kinase kinase kinase 11 n=1 Tax=Portunus trituberculatus TaxID=210409 RepID=A0A5B7F9F7_PORTR|nr:Mitogen-activated protein kinase kinase kinase 11 [Portunus trituberculatus]
MEDCLLSQEGVQFVLSHRRQVLGSGATAVVTLLRWQGHKAVVKKMKAETAEIFENELSFLKQLCGAGGAPELIGVSHEPPLMVLSYRGCLTLLDALQGLGLSDSLILWIGLEVVRCLHQVHALGIVHNDIKNNNVTLFIPQDETQPPQVSIIDYGLACHTGFSLGFRLAHKADRYFWIAPEVLAGGISTPYSDIFSLGVLLQRMLLFMRRHRYRSFLARVAQRAQHQDAICRPTLEEVEQQLAAGLLTLTSTPPLASPQRPNPPILPKYCYSCIHSSPPTTSRLAHCQRFGRTLKAVFHSLVAKISRC